MASKKLVKEMIDAAESVNLPTETPEVTINEIIPISKILDLRVKNPNMSIRQMGKVLGCSHANIIKRLEPYREEIEALPSFKKNRGDMLAMVQNKLLNSVTIEDIKGASLLQKLSAFGILYDKERLETGQSTNNTSVLATVVQSLHEKL